MLLLLPLFFQPRSETLSRLITYNQEKVHQMEQIVNQKYEGPQYLDGDGAIKPLQQFRTAANQPIARQILGHHWPDGTEFRNISHNGWDYFSGETIAEITRIGDKPFSIGDVVCGSYEITNKKVCINAVDPDGVPYELTLVPRITEILEQGAAKTASEIQTPYMWAKVVMVAYFREGDSQQFIVGETA